jgi:GTP-binding protein
MSKTTKQLPQVAIFGRTNVGKSMLFNKLTEKNQALVSNIAGTTRDSNIGEVEWRGKKFKVIDTGGIMDIKFLEGKKEKTNDIEAEVQKQARDIIKRADLVLFMVDALSGLLPQDRQMALLVKKILPPIKGGKKGGVILVINKVDSQKIRKTTAEFYKLSLGEPALISAATGSGTGDLLDIIIKKLPTIKKSKILDPELLIPGTINVSILGQPNVGKSSLLNSILGEKRVIVSPTPHTTREPQDTFLEYQGQDIKLIDTAGISKKGKQTAYGKKEKKYALEKMGIAKSLSSLDKSDIVLFVIDISEPITRQDLKVLEEIVERKKSLVLIANKWDLVPEKDTKKYTEYLRGKLPFINWAPIQFTSALTGEKTRKVLDLILEMSEQRKKEISDSILNSFLMRIVKKHKPSKGKGSKHPRIHKFNQVKSNPPIFELRIGSKDDLHFSYVRFIENRLREKFGFLGTPITIYVGKNKAVHGSHNS